jgi:glucosamine kinase
MEHAARWDPIAMEVLSQAALDAGRMITRLLDAGAPSVCLLGGVAEPLSAWLSPAIKERLASPIGDAMDGAILMARMAQAPASSRAAGGG